MVTVAMGVREFTRCCTSCCSPACWSASGSCCRIVPLFPRCHSSTCGIGNRSRLRTCTRTYRPPTLRAGKPVQGRQFTLQIILAGLCRAAPMGETYHTQNAAERGSARRSNRKSGSGSSGGGISTGGGKHLPRRRAGSASLYPPAFAGLPAFHRWWSCCRSP